MIIYDKPDFYFSFSVVPISEHMEKKISDLFIIKLINGQLKIQ